MIIYDEYDVQKLSAEIARKQSTFGGEPRFTVPESSSADGSSFLSQGYTIPPLCLGAFEQARQAGTNGSATAFSYYMSQVYLYSDLADTLLVFLCCLLLTPMFGLFLSFM